MGYFKRPVRRGAARLIKNAFFEPAREICVEQWKPCEPDHFTVTDSFHRFVVEHSRVGKMGLFRSSDLLQQAEELSDRARSELRAVFRWFNTNLPAPHRLPRGAVCWFRSDASESLDRLRTLIEVYRLAGHQVLMQTTRLPGRIVYRDDYQVAAIPFADRHAISSAV